MDFLKIWLKTSHTRKLHSAKYQLLQMLLSLSDKGLECL